MSALLTGNNAASRLVEVLGSTALLTDPIGQTSDPSLPVNGLAGDLVNDAGSDQPVTDATGTLAPALAMAPVDAVLNDPALTGDLPATTGLTGVGDLPIIGALPGLASGDGSTLTLAGPDGTLQPVLDPVNTAILDIHSALEALSHETGTAEIVHGITNLGETIGLGRIGTVENSDGHTNLVTDALNAPGMILNGDVADPVAHIGADLSDVINAASALNNSALFGSDPANPIPSIIYDVGHDLQTTPLVTVDGGNNANDGGLLGGTLGSLDNPSSGHLIDADVGPQQDNGLALNVLSQPDTGPQHTAEVNAVDVAPGGPHLADLGLLTGSDGLHIPSLNGAGSDGLIGSLPTGTIAGADAVTAPVAAPLDIGVVHDVMAPLVSDHGVLNAHASHII